MIGTKKNCAAVEAYLDMQKKTRSGERFSKVDIYRTLGARFGRTAKAFEYRMQNISYVLSIHGRDWISGLKPAKNVGTKIASIIEEQLSELEGRRLPPVADFEIAVREEMKKKDIPNHPDVKNLESLLPRLVSSCVSFCKGHGCSLRQGFLRMLRQRTPPSTA